MNTKHLLRCIVVLALIPTLSQGAAYIKFDGVDGESKDKDHKGWIDLTSVSTRDGGHDNWIIIESFSQVVHRDVAARNVRVQREAASGLATGKRDAASGKSTGRRDAATGMATGKRQHKPIRVTKRIDKASPMLAQSLSNGGSIGNVTIQRVQDGKTETLLLVNAKVSGIDKAGSSEHVSFAYEKIRQVAQATVRGWDPAKKEAIVGEARSR